MTGMYNRLGYRKLACCMFEEKKQTGENLSIIFMDMDRLKSINDEFGHIYGDRAIKIIASAILKYIPEGAVAVRSGGDEAAVSADGQCGMRSHGYDDRARSGRLCVRSRCHHVRGEDREKGEPHLRWMKKASNRAGEKNKKVRRRYRQMKIERERVRETFREYTDAYDATDEKIKLKIDHTYRVAELCERIAKAERMEKTEVDLAWLLGMLHDVGRFEQLRRYGTFSDADSIDHAALGADILFGGALQEGKGLIRMYVDDAAEDEVIETAIRVHSAYRIPEGLAPRTEKLCHILRDADKIDILRVNVDVPLEEIYNTTTEELRNAAVTPAVMESFYEHHATLRSIKRTPVDHVVGHISLVFELVFPESVRIVKEQGYLEKLLHFESRNAVTNAQFAELWAEMECYLKGR